MDDWIKPEDEMPPVGLPVLVVGEAGVAVATWRETMGNPFPFVEPYRQSLNGKIYLWRRLPPLPVSEDDLEWGREMIDEWEEETRTDG